MQLNRRRAANALQFRQGQGPTGAVQPEYGSCQLKVDNCQGRLELDFRLAGEQ